MPGAQATTFLDLHVGQFRLALSADHVLGVVPEASPPVALRGEQLPFCDLSTLFAETQRPRAPFAICFEAGSARVAVGVDRVDHLRVTTDAKLLTMPTFGLRLPELFLGILRDPSGLLLVLSPVRLAELTAPK
jgi:hypothetical protein